MVDLVGSAVTDENIAVVAYYAEKFGLSLEELLKALSVAAYAAPIRAKPEPLSTYENLQKKVKYVFINWILGGYGNFNSNRYC